MRHRKTYKIVEKDLGVDMTPMLDIIFILLIFFIVSTSFVKDKGFLVDKVEEKQAANNNSVNMTIHIDENGIVYFNNKIVDVNRIPAQIENFIANTPTNSILVRPHHDTKYQKVVDVLDQIKPFKHLKITIGIYKP